MSQHALTQEKEVAPVIADYWEHAAFPFELVPRMAKLNLGGATIKGYGCPGQSVLGTAMAVIEIARVDASMSTFIMVHNSLAMLTIGRVFEFQSVLFMQKCEGLLGTVRDWHSHCYPNEDRILFSATLSRLLQWFCMSINEDS